jgi:hypothetical protein
VLLKSSKREYVKQQYTKNLQGYAVALKVSKAVFPLVKFSNNDSDTFLLALPTLGSSTEEIALFEVAKQINSLSLMYSPNKCRQFT